MALDKILLQTNSVVSPTPTIVQGIVLVDKPQNWTSHDVVGKLRRTLGVKRIGHTGTLDPMATGLLIVLVGRNFTKLQGSFLEQDKEYEGVFELGWNTDTYDALGKVITVTAWEKIQQVSSLEIELACQFWMGTHLQQVPAFSAVKFQGRKLYQLARYEQDLLPVLPAREITIYKFELKKISKDVEKKAIIVSFIVKCSSGTYIRSLVNDIGIFLKIGATLTSLRRTSIGRYLVKNAVTPDLVTATKLQTDI